HPTLVIVENAAQMPDVTTTLLRVGFDDVKGYMEGGMDSWETSGFPLNSLPTISVHELKERIHGKSTDQITALDLRTDKEWTDGHIEGALHIHGGKLQERYADVPKDRPVSVLCGSGYRSTIAASFLLREGYSEVSNVAGGMSAWKAAGFPQVR